MVSLNQDILYPTMVVGSLPRPQWVRDLIEERKSGRIGMDKFNMILDDAIPMAIRLQEQAGVDFISDGEWRRDSYIKIFSESVQGFRKDLINGGGAVVPNLMYPAVVSEIRQHRNIALEEAEFLLKNTQSRILVAIPSPYTLSRRMWSSEFSKSIYHTPDDFMEACIPIIRREILLLKELGVQAIQLDDPWLALLVDPVNRKERGIVNVDREFESCIKGLNEATKGISSDSISLHLCHAHFNRSHSTTGPYNIIMEALGEMDVGRFAMEFATPDAGGLQVLKYYPGDKVLGLGVIDHTDRHIETPEEVVSRVEKAMDFLPKERITLNPDCGFSPSSSNPMDLDAYSKLCAMSKGAQVLRQKYG